MASWLKYACVAVAVLGAAVWYVTLNVWSYATATVQPGQQAVRLHETQIVEVLGPGLHFFNGTVDEVIVYDTLFERVHAVPAAFMVEECPADIEVIYSVGDVAAFHEAGGDFAPIADVDAQIAAFAEGRTFMLNDSLSDVMAELHAHLRSAVTAGFQIIRVSADLGECGPQPPRIVMERQAMPAPVVDGVLGAERTEPFNLSLITSDSARIEVRDAVATYDVVDAALVQTCFGSNPVAAAERIEMMSQQGLRLAVGYATFADFAAALGAVQEAESGRVEEFAIQCGVAERAVDFSAATFTHMIAVNCDETPDAAVCTQ